MPAPRVLLIGGAADFGSTLSSRGIEGAVIERAAGPADALRKLRVQACDVVVSDPATTVEEDLALLEAIHDVRPGVRLIVLAPKTTPGAVIAALRAQVFACFVAPIDEDELAIMVRRGVREADWRDGIEVCSASDAWISLRVGCRLLDAERLVRFLTELRPELPEAIREDVMMAFREILLNAMEHGGHFDPEQVVEVSAVRTAHTIIYHVRDPGPGFIEAVRRGRTEAAADPVSLEEKRAEQGIRPGGFGVLLAQHIVDEMIYSESGNEVLLIKYLTP